jgi:tripartite-type tricarboxylate transporter receptor subunit TctC
MVAAGLSTGLAASAAHAQAEPVSFAGKTININIGYAPGSGNDIYGRLVARHLGKFIPGNPTVIPQNMPGAGSFKAANFMYGVAPKDGTSLGYISQAAATEELLGSDSALQFKTAKFNWIGRISSYNIVPITWHTSKVKTVADAQTIPATLGATGVGSTVYIYPHVMNSVLGTKFKIVSGYEGTASTALAMERGEVDGTSMGWFTIKSTKKDWLDNKKINVLTQFVGQRHADLPDVPTIVELARNAEEKQLFELFANEGEIGKAILAPPGVPAATVATLRAAFDAMAKSPEYIADGEKLQVELDPMTGARLQTMIANVGATPPDVVARAKKLLGK